MNAISPGYFDTQLNTTLLKDDVRYDQIIQRIPIGRLGVPKDIKGLIIFLASDASNFITGTSITIDGGYSSR